MSTDVLAARTDPRTSRGPVDPDAVASPAELRDVAREHGVVAALTALAALHPVAALPGECVLLPDDVPPPAGAARVGVVASDDGALVVWRAARPGAAAADGASTVVVEPPAADDVVRVADAAWRVGVAWVRTGLCERLTEQAVERLRGRSVGGTTTVNLAPVRLVLADAALAHLEAQSLLGRPAAGRAAPVPAATLARVTAVLDRSSRAVHNLFGASGYVDGEAARLARTIDLLGHASGTLPTGPAGGREEQHA